MFYILIMKVLVWCSWYSSWCTNK